MDISLHLSQGFESEKVEPKYLLNVSALSEPVESDVSSYTIMDGSSDDLTCFK